MLEIIIGVIAAIVSALFVEEIIAGILLGAADVFAEVMAAGALAV